MIERSLRLALFACLVTAASWVASDPFVGDWKLNASKSTLTDRMKVEGVRGNTYAFDFGGGPETIVVDGTDQPSPVYKGDTISVTAEGETWKVIRKRNGRTIVTAIWRLSKDGRSLTDHFTGVNADGSPYTLNYVYERKAGGSGFAGTWVSRSLQAVNYVVALQTREYEEHGLAFIDSASQFTGNMNFPSALVRRLNERTLELMRKNTSGELSEFLELRLSPDVKTLTMTPRSATGSEPHIFVFDRR